MEVQGNGSEELIYSSECFAIISGFCFLIGKYILNIKFQAWRHQNLGPEALEAARRLLDARGETLGHFLVFSSAFWGVMGPS